MAEAGGDYNPTTGTVTFQNIGAYGFIYESAQDLIAAHVGGGQALATQLVAQTNRITVVTNPGDSVKLPLSVAGLEILIINHGANPVQVFGAGTDTIDDAATAVGVSQMPASFVLYSCATPGAWYTEGLANGFAGGLQTVSTLDGVVAAGTNQGNATVLPPRMAYNVSTVPAGTGVLLPPSVSGAEVAINNNQATNALLVYPNGTDTINAGGAGVGFSHGAGTIVIYYCFTAGKWFTK
jgi:hypothetical protein